MVISHPKRFGRDLPLYNLEKPPLFKGRNCIVYSLLIGDNNEPESDYHRYIINSAFWAAHSWRVNSNLDDNEWNIMFHVERQLYEQPSVREQFEIANMTDFVVTYDVLQGDATCRRTGVRLYATTEPAFERYTRVYLTDADMFLCRKPGADVFSLDGIYDIGADESLVSIFSANPVSYFRLMRPPYDLPPSEAKFLLRTHLERYLGRRLDNVEPSENMGTHYTKGYKCLSGIMAWNPQQLRQSWKDMVDVLTPHVCNEENQWAIYTIKENDANYPLTHIWDLKLFGNFYDNFMQPNTPDNFLEHVVIEEDDYQFDKDAWISKWYSHIGVN